MGKRGDRVVYLVVLLGVTLLILGLIFCGGRLFGVQIVQIVPAYCQLVIGIAAGGLFILYSGVILFVLNRLCDDSSAREREMRRQIAFESPRVIMPDEEKRRD